MTKWRRILYHPNLPLGENGQRVTACTEHIALSKSAAKEGMVLLKNDGCDGLIIETGHFVIDDVYAYTRGKNTGKVYFTHNGREILNNGEAAEQKVKDYFGDKAVICFENAQRLYHL